MPELTSEQNQIRLRFRSLKDDPDATNREAVELFQQMDKLELRGLNTDFNHSDVLVSVLRRNGVTREEVAELKEMCLKGFIEGHGRFYVDQAYREIGKFIMSATPVEHPDEFRGASFNCS